MTSVPSLLTTPTTSPSPRRQPSSSHPRRSARSTAKTALSNYWRRALDGNPDLHFDLIEVYVGVHTLVLHYRNQNGTLINEVLTFHEGLVVDGHAAHAPAAGLTRNMKESTR